jgi:hypothetical protein
MRLLSQIIYSCKTLYMFRAVFLSISRSSKLRIQQQAYVEQLLHVQFWAPDDRRKDRPQHVERFTRINNLSNRYILLDVLYEYITMHRPMNIKN